MTLVDLLVLHAVTSTTGGVAGMPQVGHAASSSVTVAVFGPKASPSDRADRARGQPDNRVEVSQAGNIYPLTALKSVYSI